ncbi:methyltransferase-like protein 22 isoform X2 [Nilaparvata lugens]|uniref:methyltransferase-like protein 22 isoform X2 n=1 Tax=Nilaparvata lugens TaxID=108931 RepID=UPI00193E8F83|nr:methyltransferase-like protein 22 isoform X2 [Nilaparvata lugens]XP_039283812.1 methyltransferase-like protein 22 isoform X2 [Nilaparvata lugens]XP_039283813.1 methyltransferase-like protein 22 isoform X2 [Nilaparvata lugens]XP_039283814.1 methyltransferase-like protein 22 isoform X2 [Nilaparvata lugens]
MSINEAHVTSELYSKNTKLDENSSGYVNSKFHFHLPSNFNGGEEIRPNLEVDKDGDYVVDRKKDLIQETITIEHKASTSLKLVGLQIWRGALLLADYILSNKTKFANKVILELGAGVGLTSIVAGMLAKEVIFTDIDEGTILDLIKRNVSNNKKLIKSNSAVLPLDFMDMSWNDELMEKLKTVDIVIAADVIYDNEVTEGFVKALTRILQIPPKKSALIALEKRYVFTIDDLDTTAPCCEYFLEYLKLYWNRPPMSRWTFRELKIDFDQFFEYKRLKQLILWEVTTD